MSIVSIKCKKVFAGPGNFAYIAEALVVKPDQSEVYVTVDWYDGEEYTIQGKSMYEFMAEDGDDPCVDFDECYTSWKDAKASEYAEVFSVLRGVVKKLG